MKQEPPVNPDLHNRNDSFQSDVAAYAPRFPDFLKNRATPVEVSEQGETKATATYVDGNRRFGGRSHSLSLVWPASNAQVKETTYE
jgi:hypothetical protein